MLMEYPIGACSQTRPHPGVKIASAVPLMYPPPTAVAKLNGTMNKYMLDG